MLLTSFTRTSFRSYGLNNIFFNSQVIETEKKLELELYPITLLLYRHQQSNSVGKGLSGGAGTSSGGVNAVSSAAGSAWANVTSMYASPLSATLPYAYNQHLLPPKK